VTTVFSSAVSSQNPVIKGGRFVIEKRAKDEIRGNDQKIRTAITVFKIDKLYSTRCQKPLQIPATFALFKAMLWQRELGKKHFGAIIITVIRGFTTLFLFFKSSAPGKFGLRMRVPSRMILSLPLLRAHRGDDGSAWCALAFKQFESDRDSAFGKQSFAAAESDGKNLQPKLINQVVL
jgi:hypothetical protein